MLRVVRTMEISTTLQFDAFWDWLQRHPNCILRAGTPEAVLYDDDDLHWHFGREDERVLVVQLTRGKRIVAELLVEPEAVSYIEEVPADTAEEHVFELVSDTKEGRFAPYFFVMAHGLEVDAPASLRHVH